MKGNKIRKIACGYYSFNLMNWHVNYYYYFRYELACGYYSFNLFFLEMELCGYF